MSVASDDSQKYFKQAKKVLNIYRGNETDLFKDYIKNFDCLMPKVVFYHLERDGIIDNEII